MIHQSDPYKLQYYYRFLSLMIQLCTISQTSIQHCVRTGRLCDETPPVLQVHSVLKYTIIIYMEAYMCGNVSVLPVGCHAYISAINILPIIFIQGIGHISALWF